MKLGEKIVAAEGRLNDYRDEIAAIVAKAAEENDRDLTADETDTIEGLNGEVKAVEKNIAGLKAAEKALATRAEKRQAEGQPAGTILPVAARVKSDEGGFPVLTKVAVAKTLAHILKTSPEAVVQQRYADDPRVAAGLDYVEKAATSAATTTGAGWAAELVQTDVTGFIEELKPVSVYGAMADVGVAIPFGGNNAVTIPKRSGAGNVSGSFVGENASIPVKQDNYGSTTFNQYKAAVITVFTEELARRSNPQVEALLRQAILDDTGVMLDSVLLDPAAAAIAGIRPASPWNGAPTQASAGNTIDNILTDLKYLIGLLTAANAGRIPALVMNPARALSLSLLTNATGNFVFRDELAQGRLMGIRVIQSTTVPGDHVFIIDLADFATAFGTPEFTASDQVTLAMADDDGVAPTMAATNAVNDAGGSVHISDAAGTTPPTQVRSMFQTWSIALRMVLPIAWGTMRPTVGYLTAVSW